MPAIDLNLQRVTHPQREPYVRSTTFIDGEGPPPFGYFDETQDHLGGLYHGLLGWKYSIDAEDFVTESPHAGFLGRRMRISKATGCTAAPDFLPPPFFHYGSWIVTCGNTAWEFEAASAPVTLDGDFLLTARVILADVANLNTGALGGFTIAVNNPGLAPVGPGFAAGSDSSNWQILYAPDNASPVALADTGIRIDSPRFVSNGSLSWYTLQVSRVAGAVRWFINGQLCRLGGNEGLYYPYRLLNGCKYVHAGRNNPAMGIGGFGIDICNLIAERSIS